MNNPTGNLVSSSPVESWRAHNHLPPMAFHLGQGDRVTPHDGNIPCATNYRVIRNKTGEEVILAGAKLLNYIQGWCGTLDIGVVLLRMTFIKA